MGAGRPLPSTSSTQAAKERSLSSAWGGPTICRPTPGAQGTDMAGQPVTVYSDSQLVVNTLTKWAKGWEAKGWKRREGEIANLDLVQQAWALVKAKPSVRIEWIRAHDGSRWNEYADALSTAHLRSEV